MIRDYPISTDHIDSPTSTTSSPPLPSIPLSQQFELNNSTPPSTAASTAATKQILQAPYVKKSNLNSSSPGSSSPALLINLPNESSSISTHVEELPSQTLAIAAALAEREAWQNSEIRNKLKKQIDELPRTGSLLTLDVKGNDIRVSRCSYLDFDEFTRYTDFISVVFILAVVFLEWSSLYSTSFKEE